MTTIAKEELAYCTGASALNRSAVYGLASRLFRHEPSADLLHYLMKPELKKTFDLIAPSLSESLMKMEDISVFLSELGIEYTRLFLGPGPHISPYGSVHHPGEERSQLWGQTTVDINLMMGILGLTPQAGNSLLPDHVSIELEFMQKLCAFEADAPAGGSEIGRIVDIQSMFLEDHLNEWLPVFCKKIDNADPVLFYQGVSELLRSFLESEMNREHHYS